MKKKIFIFLILLFSLAASAQAAETDLIISEIMYDWPGSDNNHEWVEIYNTGSELVEVLIGSGNTWRFFDGSNHILNLAQGTTTITTGEFFIIADNAEQFLLDYPNFSGNIFDTSMSLGNSGDDLALLFDEISFAQTNYSSDYGASGTGSSLEKINLTNNDTISNWQESSVTGGTPGQVNSEVVDDPGEDPDGGEEDEEENNNQEEPINNGGSTAPPLWQYLQISEFLPNPAGSDSNEWIELYNNYFNPIDLSGYKLQDNSARIFTISEEDNLTIPAGGYLVLAKSLTGISLNNTGGDAVKLYNPEEEVIEIIEYTDTALEDKSYARQGDVFLWSGLPTPGQANQFLENQPPAAEIELLSEEIVSGEKVILSGEKSFDPEEGELKYLWDFGDETSGDEIKENHIYQSPGEYLVKLTITDSQGLSAEASKVIKVTETTVKLNLTDIQPIDWQLTDLAITEFIPNPVGSDDNEWIELANFSNQEINLKGWQLDDSEGGSKPYTFTEDFILLPGEYKTVNREQNKITLNNSNDSARLLTPLGDVWQEVIYDKIPEGHSYAWDDFNHEWFVNNNPTPNASDFFVESQVSPLTITDVYDLDKNTIVYLQGVAVQDINLDKNILYLADYSGNEIDYANLIEIYFSKKDWPQIKAGDLVEIGGKISRTGKLPRVKISKSEDILVIASGIKLTNTDNITTDDLSEDLLGDFITVKGVVVKKSGQNIYLASDIEEEQQVRVYTKFDIKDLEIKKGMEIIVTGILSETNSGFKLIPLTKTDILIPQVLGEMENSNLEVVDSVGQSEQVNKVGVVNKTTPIKKILIWLLALTSILGLIFIIKRKKS